MVKYLVIKEVKSKLHLKKLIKKLKLHLKKLIEKCQIFQHHMEKILILYILAKYFHLAIYQILVTHLLLIPILKKIWIIKVLYFSLKLNVNFIVKVIIIKFFCYNML